MIKDEWYDKSDAIGEEHRRLCSLLHSDTKEKYKIMIRNYMENNEGSYEFFYHINGLMQDEIENNRLTLLNNILGIDTRLSKINDILS